MPLVSFAFGLGLFLVDAGILVWSVRLLLGGVQRRQGVLIAACALRLVIVAVAVYAGVGIVGLSGVWLVVGALGALALFCAALVANPRQYFSLFSGGKLR